MGGISDDSVLGALRHHAPHKDSAVSGGTWHPGGCRCSGCRPPAARTATRPRPVSPRPVYRYAPRSHVYNCPCDRCVQVRGQRNTSSGAIIWPVLIVLGLVSAGVGALAKAIGQHPAQVAAWAGSIAILGLLTWGIVVINRREDRRVAARRLAPLSGPPMAAMPPASPSAQLIPHPPDTPICLHLGAVDVKTLPTPLGAPETVAWLCVPPELGGTGCGARLGADFGDTRRSCCGTPPDDDHLYNCQYK